MWQVKVLRRINGMQCDRRLLRFEKVYKKCISSSSICSQMKFPWRQDLQHDQTPNHPFLHKFVGLVLLRRAVRNKRSTFNIQEFSAGIEIAVKAISECIGTNDADGRLKMFVGNSLFMKLKKSIEEIKEKGLSIDLEIASVRPVKISRARFVCGQAGPGDEHVLEFLGQQIITSRRELEEIIERETDGANIRGTYKEAKIIGAQAVRSGIKFQIDVKFVSNERFYIFNPEDDGQILQGVNKLCKVQHLWCFETSINVFDDNIDDQEYPLDWQVVNMDEICDVY